MLINSQVYNKALAWESRTGKYWLLRWKPTASVTERDARHPTVLADRRKVTAAASATVRAAFGRRDEGKDPGFQHVWAKQFSAQAGRTSPRRDE